MPVGIDSITNRRPSITGSDPAWLACDPLYCMRKLPLHTVTYWRQSVAHPPRLQSSIVSCSPLEGDCRPPRRQTVTGPARVRFSFCADASPELRHLEPSTLRFSFALLQTAVLRARPSRFTLCGFKQTREEHHGLDHSHPRRNLHRPRDQRLPPGRVLILRRIRVVLNGAPLRHRAWLGGGGRFSTMELSLPDMPVGVGG